MTGRARAAASVLAITSTGLIAACGSAAPATRGSPAPWAPPAGAQLLDTSTDTAAGTWATVVMGGTVASRNNFWQLFIRPAGSQRWQLVTPPGVADNGGLVLATAGQSLITGIRPSQGLTFTPLTQTRDGGQAWSSTGPLDASLANVPDALAAAPGGGSLLALLTDGSASVAAPAYTRWAAVASPRSLDATAAGSHCGMRELTAVAYAPSGVPMLAGQCARPGTAGILADVNGAWQAAGLSLPASLAGQVITVLRLTVQEGMVTALLQAGSGPGTRLLAAWSASGIGSWTTSAPFLLGHAAVASASFGPAGTVAITTTAGSGAAVTGAARSWHTLPALPVGTATLAVSASGTASALAVRGGTLTVWQLQPGDAQWTRAQVISVPIQYGSSG